MAEAEFHKTHIKAWREDRQLSLRKLAGRMEKEPGVQLLSHASIGRIEKGEQPVTLSQLHAFAQALNVSVGMLLEMDPTKEGKVVDLMRRLDDAKRQQVIDYIEFLSRPA